MLPHPFKLRQPVKIARPQPKNKEYKDRIGQILCHDLYGTKGVPGPEGAFVIFAKSSGKIPTQYSGWVFEYAELDAA